MSEVYVNVISEAMCPNVRKRIQNIQSFKDKLLGVTGEAHGLSKNDNIQETTEETLVTPVEVEPVVEVTPTVDTENDEVA